ncbi:MAG: hypothetical protein OXI97_18580 [Acidimicrobiaceae bacterium]|nr:hypothetical protein [Acidimicrobiaceae bacterium]MDE0321880.1 hypothetical protein [Acidimicrobiaceae bacterium]
MSLLRRALLAVVVGGLVTVVLRLRSSQDLPRREGSWRELAGPDLR